MLFWLETFFAAAEIAGTAAFAASGAMIAIDRDLDMFGVLFLGIITAVGGGVIRDILLGITPPSAFRNSIYVAVAAMTALAVFLVAWRLQRLYNRRYTDIGHIVNALDALGLGIFSVIGVEAALTMGHADNLFLCVFMGMTTAVGGGILRDVCSRTVPMVLRRRIYALAAIIGSLVYACLRRTTLSTPLATIAALFVTMGIRLCASVFHWNLPVVHRDAGGGEQP